MPFEPEVVKSICDYMNTDPMQSTLTIVQGLTKDRSVTSVVMTGFDENACYFLATKPDGESPVTIPWIKPITERPEVRTSLFALLDLASDSFGN